MFIRSKNFVHPDSPQYVGKFNISSLNYDAAVQPVTTSVRIKRLSETRYKNLTGEDDDLIINEAVEDLINIRDIGQKSQNYLNRSCLFLKGYCIENDGDITTKDPGGFYISPDTIQQDLIVIAITDAMNCSSHVNITVNKVSPCFPMDFLQEKLNEKCPWDRRRFASTKDTKWPAWTPKFYVNSGITLGQLEVDTEFTSLFEDGDYTLILKSSAYANVITVKFEYYSQLNLLQKQNIDHFKPRVTGKTFQISLYKDIFFKDPKTVSIIINKEGGESNSYVQFKNKDALTLLGSARLKKCPSGPCLAHFAKWRQVYRDLVTNGRPDCATDQRMYFSYLTFCDDQTG